MNYKMQYNESTMIYGKWHQSVVIQGGAITVLNFSKDLLRLHELLQSLQRSTIFFDAPKFPRTTLSSAIFVTIPDS